VRLLQLMPVIWQGPRRAVNQASPGRRQCRPGSRWSSQTR
jgi:hypothetical protein